MRRPLASLALALLVALPVAAPIAATEPAPAEDQPAATSPSPDPATDPSPTPPPATDPTAGPTTDPSADPSPDASADPTTGPATPGPASDGSAAPDSPPAVSPPDASVTPSAGAGPIAADDTRGVPDVAGEYIVVLDDRADTSAVVTRHRQREGTRATRTFGRAFTGFTARLDRAQRAALLADPNVAAVVPDEVIELAAQTIPTGVSRIGTRTNATADIDGVDQRVNADVAIVDTGIALHPDLNVAGGYDCSTTDRTRWRDVEGHGTHVAGTVGAIDNDFGVVGVAPGVRLWAVKILNDDGYGKLSWYVCGLDWILAQRDPDDSSRPRIEAVNMSVTKWGSDDVACGTKNDDILHAAICRVVAGRITVVAAAANDSGSAARRVPAAYNEVITVSALADTDGKPGALGGNRCYSWGTYDKDDTFADFSNYGSDVDIIAPGKCIWSTRPAGRYAYLSGTSMAAPAVTGAVALYKAGRPNASPLEVREALVYLGNYGWKTSSDPDGRPDKLLDVSKLGPLGTFDFTSPAAAAATAEAGSTATLTVRITRSPTFFERVKFSTTSLPSGWTAAWEPSSVMGWTAIKTNLRLTVPKGTASGKYTIGLRATNQGREERASVSVTVTNDDPTAYAPTIAPFGGAVVGMSALGTPTTVAMRLAWSKATDPSSAITEYEIQRSTNGGAWVTIAHKASATSADVGTLALSATYRFRIRAKDAVGNWSPWATGPVLTFANVSDRSSSLAYRGSWSAATVSGSTHHVHTTSKSAGATVRTTFTGRGIALIMPRSSGRGKATIYIDGVAVATIDTYASSAQSRRIVFARSWGSSATHSIIVKVLGTSGRPSVSLDGLIITR